MAQRTLTDKEIKILHILFGNLCNTIGHAYSSIIILTFYNYITN